MALEAILHISRDGKEIMSQRIDGEASVGRSDDCSIKLDDRAISRKHMKFSFVGGTNLQFEKKSEFSPVLLNGSDATRADLKNGDMLIVGPFQFKVELFDAKTRTTEQVSDPLPFESAPMTPPAAPQETQRVSPSEMAGMAGMAGGEGEMVMAPLDASSSSGGGHSIESQPSGAEVSLSSTQDVALDSGPEVPGLQLDSSGGDLPGTDKGQDSGDGHDPLNISLSEPEAEPEVSDDEGEDEPRSDVQIADMENDGKTRLTPNTKMDVRLVFPPGSANHEIYEIKQNEVSIGRGKNCTIVLNDKKSSRKHVIIRRAGVSFSIKDLGSANGTLVNGVRIEEQELSGADRITIGDTTFEFQALSSDYQNQDFLNTSLDSQEDEAPQVPMDWAAGGADAGGVSQEPEQAAYAPIQLGSQPNIYQNQAGQNQGQNTPITGTPGAASPGAKPTLYEKYIRNFKSLPAPKKIMVGFVGLSLLYFVFIEDEEQEIPQSTKNAKTQGAGQKGGRGLASFQQLDPEKKRFVDSQYNLAFDHYKNKEFDKSLYEIQKIFVYVEDYRNSRELERYSKEGKRKAEAIEEEKRKKEREEQLKVRIAQLHDEASALMKDRKYEQVEEIFGQILALDPENKKVLAWREEMKAESEKLAAEEQKKRILADTLTRAKGLVLEAKNLRKAKECHEAIAVAEEVLGMGIENKKVLAQAKTERQLCVKWIAARRTPVLRSALAAEKAGNYVKAFKLFKRVSEIDPPNPAGPEGIERVSDRLHEMAKVLYTEAVIAENYSDLEAARAKYLKITESIPSNDKYYLSAKRKLEKFTVLDGAMRERTPAGDGNGGAASSFPATEGNSAMESPASDDGTIPVETDNSAEGSDNGPQGGESGL